jgi:hypothetical protein
MSNPVYPLPTGNTPGLFSVPLNNSNVEAVAIRQHEYGHVALES